MASRKGMKQLKDAQMRNEPYIKSRMAEKRLLQKKEEETKMHDKWLAKCRKASTEEKSHMVQDLQESNHIIALEWSQNHGDH